MSDRVSKPVTGEPVRVRTGVGALDAILEGGLTAGHLYLVQGDPGAGKTTLGLQFLLEGVRSNERALYITMSESRAELEAMAAGHGWSLAGLEILEILTSEEALKAEAQYTVFKAEEVEPGETVTRILEEVDRLLPQRVVIDSKSEFRLMASTGLQFRHQSLALKEYFRGRRCTAMLLDDRTTEDNDRQLQSMASGVIVLEQLAPEFGGARRRLRILKMRGRTYRTGYHDFSIATGGLQVYPRFSQAVPTRKHAARQLLSGVPGLDELIPGGVDRGTSTMIVGPAGTGKSTLALQYVVAAAAQGERSAILAFDEQPATMLARAAGLGIELAKQVEAGRVTIRSIDPAEMSPGEFAFTVRSLADDDGHGASIVVIDSVNGYRLGLPEERFLVAQLHEILVYLAHHDVATFLVVTQHGVIGQALEGPVEATYLADTVIVLRHFEAGGAIRQAISVVKRRAGPHEHSIREFSLSSGGVSVGPPLLGFRGLLSGFPTIADDAPEPRG